MSKFCDSCLKTWDPKCICRVPTDAAFVIREDFKPDFEAARDTVKAVRKMLAQRKEDENRLENLENAGKAAHAFSKYIGTHHETDEWLKLHIELRKALAKLGLHVEDALLEFDR